MLNNWEITKKLCSQSLWMSDGHHKYNYPFYLPLSLVFIFQKQGKHEENEMVWSEKFNNIKLLTLSQNTAIVFVVVCS